MKINVMRLVVDCLLTEMGRRLVYHTRTAKTLNMIHKLALSSVS